MIYYGASNLFCIEKYLEQTRSQAYRGLAYASHGFTGNCIPLLPPSEHGADQQASLFGSCVGAQEKPGASGVCPSVSEDSLVRGIACNGKADWRSRVLLAEQNEVKAVDSQACGKLS